MIHHHSDFDEYTPAPDTRSIWIPALILLTFWTGVVLIVCALLSHK